MYEKKTDTHPNSYRHIRHCLFDSSQYTASFNKVFSQEGDTFRSRQSFYSNSAANPARDAYCFGISKFPACEKTKPFAFDSVL